MSFPGLKRKKSQQLPELHLGQEQEQNGLWEEVELKPGAPHCPLLDKNHQNRI